MDDFGRQTQMKLNTILETTFRFAIDVVTTSCFVVTHPLQLPQHHLPETPISLLTLFSISLPSTPVVLPSRFTRCLVLYPVLWLAPDRPLPEIRKRRRDDVRNCFECACENLAPIYQHLRRNTLPFERSTATDANSLLTTTVILDTRLESHGGECKGAESVWICQHR